MSDADKDISYTIKGYKMGGKSIDWSKWDHLLGVITDKELANKIGCICSTVNDRRNKLLIKSKIRLKWSIKDNELFKENKILCIKCGLIKNLNECFPNKDATNGYRKECKVCHALIVKKRQQTYKTYWINKLGGKCQCCGFDKYFTALQFHHVEGKDFGPTQIIYSHQSKNKDKILLELDKCCILCSNCHDAFHSKEITLEFKKDEFGWIVSKNQIDKNFLGRTDFSSKTSPN